MFHYKLSHTFSNRNVSVRRFSLKKSVRVFHFFAFILHMKWFFSDREKYSFAYVFVIYCHSGNFQSLQKVLDRLSMTHSKYKLKLFDKSFTITMIDDSMHVRTAYNQLIALHSSHPIETHFKLFIHFDFYKNICVNYFQLIQLNETNRQAKKNWKNSSRKMCTRNVKFIYLWVRRNHIKTTYGHCHNVPFAQPMLMSIVYSFFLHFFSTWSLVFVVVHFFYMHTELMILNTYLFLGFVQPFFFCSLRVHLSSCVFHLVSAANEFICVFCLQFFFAVQFVVCERLFDACFARCNIVCTCHVVYLNLNRTFFYECRTLSTPMNFFPSYNFFLYEVVFFSFERSLVRFCRDNFLLLSCCHLFCSEENFIQKNFRSLLVNK